MIKSLGSPVRDQAVSFLRFFSSLNHLDNILFHFLQSALNPWHPLIIMEHSPNPRRTLMIHINLLPRILITRVQALPFRQSLHVMGRDGLRNYGFKVEGLWFLPGSVNAVAEWFLDRILLIVFFLGTGWHFVQKALFGLPMGLPDQTLIPVHFKVALQHQLLAIR